MSVLRLEAPTAVRCPLPHPSRQKSPAICPAKIPSNAPLSVHNASTTAAVPPSARPVAIVPAQAQINVRWSAQSARKTALVRRQAPHRLRRIRQPRPRCQSAVTSVISAVTSVRLIVVPVHRHRTGARLSAETLPRVIVTDLHTTVLSSGESR